MEAFRRAKRGKLRIGVTQSFNALHFLPILAAFLHDHDGIDVTVLELANPLIIQGVAQGTLDIGVAIGRDGDAAVSTLPLYEDRLMIAFGKDHPLAASIAAPIASLERETLALLTDDFITRLELDLFLSLHGVAPRRIVSLNTFASFLSLVKVGECMSIIPT